MTRSHPVLLAAALLVGAPKVAPAQPIYQLVGCTASLTGNPATTSRIVNVDLATGAATNPRDTGIYFLGGIAYSPQTHSLLSLATFANTVAPNSLYSTDIQTGESMVVGATGFSMIFEGDLARNPVDGLFYGLQEITASAVHRFLFRVNPQSGLGTVVGDLPLPGDYSAMAFSQLGELYAVQSRFGSNGDTLLRINPNTAAILASTPLDIRLGDQAGMAIHPVTGAMYLAGGGDNGTNAKLFHLDPDTGTTSMIGEYGSGVFGLSGLTFVPVPEPNTITLIVLALGIVTVTRILRGQITPLPIA